MKTEYFTLVLPVRVCIYQESPQLIGFYQSKKSLVFFSTAFQIIIAEYFQWIDFKKASMTEYIHMVIIEAYLVEACFISFNFELVLF